MLQDYHPDRDGEEIGSAKTAKSNSKSTSGIVLPAAASEVDFDVHDPPMEQVCPPSTDPMIESLGDVNTYDVLCGRGGESLLVFFPPRLRSCLVMSMASNFLVHFCFTGGTNSQVGNKRFRKLVQEFQPTYLLARRKEKPLLARSIVLIIRKRGGRFLRKDEETGMLYEVGDVKAEAKTSQALREGLDVRATKASDKKKKKKKGDAADEAAVEKEDSTAETSTNEAKSIEKTPERPVSGKDKSSSPLGENNSPPSLPKLADEEVKAGMVHPHSPEALQFRKRRRMKALACGADKFFPDFCPPRADLARTASPVEDTNRNSGNASLQHSPVRRSSSIDDDESPRPAAPGCTAAALEIMTNAVSGGLCFGPTSTR